MNNKQITQININLINNKISIINYHNFFEDTNCRFSIDDISELQELNRILKRILIDDKLANVYVTIYYNELEDIYKNMFWYSDIIILDTNLNIDEVKSYFIDCDFEPSQISIESESLYLVSINGKNIIYNNKCKNLISIYWD